MQKPDSPSRKLVTAALLLLFAASAFLTIWLINQKPDKKNTEAAATIKTKALQASAKSALPASEPSRVSSDATDAKTPVLAMQPSTVPLDGCEAVLESADRKTPAIKLTGGDGLFDRVFIAEKKPLQFTVTLPNLVVDEPILISAPNGGNLSRQDGGLSFKAKSASEKIVLNFEPSIGRGAYTIRIQHRGESQIIDLWAGARNPLGQPGPAYVQQPVSEPANSIQ